MEIRPILSTLLRHKTAAALIVLEIALTCAIVANALFIVSLRVEGMSRISGVDEDRLVQLEISGVGTLVNPDARTTEDLAALRAIPGVEAATIANQLPFLSSNSSNTSLMLTPEQERPTLNAAQYMVGEDFVRTLGLRIVEGRDFNADEHLISSEVEAMADLTKLRSAAILSRSAAERMFPGGSAVGKVIYLGPVPLTVVGVVQDLARPNMQEGNLSHSLILPVKQHYNSGTYVVRVKDPAQRERVLRAAVTALDKVDPSRIQLGSQTYQQIREDFFRNDKAMVVLLLTVCVALLIVTALGIIGLASFWVQQRTKQIGVRRALGATRSQVLRYFQTENFILASIGIVLGMLLAFGLNQMLMTRYEMPRLPLLYLPVGAVLLWLLGQLAVFGPARRAAAVPPALATRSI